MILLSIDPGTYHTGIALFYDERWIWAGLLAASPKAPIEERIHILVAALESFRELQVPDLTDVACERVMGYEDRRPAAELRTWVNRLRQWARGHKLAWHIYHPSTVVAAVRPRGMRGKATKDIIRIGVQFLYGLDHRDWDQNILDAIAVGHCHLSKMKEAALVSRPGI